MHLLTKEQLDKVDSLLRLLREAAQTLLEMPTFKAAHTVAASVEVLEEMFHVEQIPQANPMSGSGSPYFNPPTRSVPRETSRDRSDSDDHVHQPIDFRPSGLAPSPPGPSRPGISWQVWQDLRRSQTKQRQAAKRGRYKGRMRRRR